ncbi:MAG: restriction endonuclease [SAR324 cluster bacterium]|nr:restriction endonuclease [SAR324 cluster bacterium]
MRSVPQYDKLMWPTLKAIKLLGGSGSNAEIVQEVIEQETVPETIQNELHNTGPMTELEYRMAWARTYLKKYGALENSERGVWSITDFGAKILEEQIPKIVMQVKDSSLKSSKQKQSLKQQEDSSAELELNYSWKTELLDVLKNQVSPEGFERLTQRILRESGFVEVTRQTNDKGIDGFGVLKIGLLSFRVIFQCKRYKDSVSSGAIRDFRGAMQGRADKGLFMTTGSFTAEAKKEALRDGAPLIDLFDGNEICDLIKKLKLGIEIETVEKVIVKSDWFTKI